MSLVSIPNINTGDAASQDLFNSRFAAIVAVLNGNIDATNLADNAVTTAKIANLAITAAKMETQQAWQSVTYKNSWVDYGAPFAGTAYMKDSLGFVHLRGLSKAGTIGTSTPIFTLPAGYRPLNQLIFAIHSNGTVGRVDIMSNGDVGVQQGSNAYVSVDNIMFKAEA